MISLAAKHPTAANLLMAMFLVTGSLMAMGVQRETFPDVTPREVEVQVIYAGASPEEVEGSICAPIEDALEGVQDIAEVRSQSREGVGIVTVEMAAEGSMSALISDVDSKVSAITSLPDAAEDPVVTELGRENDVLSILVGGFVRASDLYAYSEDLAARLRRLPEVSTVDVEGFSDRQLRVELDREALIRFGLSVSDIADAIRAESFDRPAGSIETRDREILVRFVNQRRTSSGLEDLIVDEQATGGVVRLGQLGEVHDLFEEAEDRVEVGGRRVGRLVVKKAKRDDTLDVAGAVTDYIEEERANAPPGLTLATTEDGSQGLVDQLSLVLTNGWQGMLLVFLVMWLFFTARLAFWVVMSLPVSFLGSFLLLPALGVSVNVMSLVGFLLALGILMDDGIVIAENISAHLADGKKPMDAAITGTREVMNGIGSSFLTTLCVLGPLAFLDGDIGTVLGVVPVVLAMVLAVSLVEAFLILPAHLGHALRTTDVTDRPRIRQRFDALLHGFRDRIVAPAARWSVRWRYGLLGTCVGALMISVAFVASGRVPFQAFPNSEGDVLAARVMMPAGTPLAKTRTVVEQLLHGLERTGERLQAAQPLGRQLIELASVRYNVNADAGESGPHLATISVDLLTTELRGTTLDEVKSTWRDETGQILDARQVTILEPGGGGPAGRAIDVRLLGDNLEELDGAAAEMMAWFERIEGVSNLASDLRPGKTELKVELLDGARSLGLTADALASQVSGNLLGSTVDEMQIGRDLYEIEAGLQANDRRGMDDLTEMRIQLPSGGEAAFSTLARVQEGRSWSRIARIGGRRAVTVTGDVDASLANTSQIFALFEEELRPVISERFPSIALDLEGETAEGKRTMGSMIQGMLLGLLGVYMLLSLQFRSYFEPVIVMSLIPLTLIGVVGGHYLLGDPITLPSLLGFASLAGIVVNDSILLVQFTRQSMNAGEAVSSAAVEGARTRFRAVLLTSVTTVAGLLPLLFEESVQAQILKGLVTSIVFGMMVSTLLVLLVVPALYATFSDFSLLRSEPAEG